MKQRPGSRRGQNKLTTSSKKSARRRAARQVKGLANRNAIVHPAMRSSWDGRRSPANNLSRIGLCGRVNSGVEKRSCSGKGNVEVVAVGKVKGEGEVEGRAVLRRLEKEAGREEREVCRVVHPGERLALGKMIRKWGEDWEGMARDLKLNYLQWNAGQLRRKVERMRKVLGEDAMREVLQGEDRRV